MRMHPLGLAALMVLLTTPAWGAPQEPPVREPQSVAQNEAEAAEAEAEDSAASDTKTEEAKAADFSNRAILEFVREVMEDDGEDGFVVDGSVGYRRGDWMFRWMPIMAPLVFSQGLGANVSAMPVVDPLALTGTAMPYTASTWRDGFGEWRERRFLRKNIEAANRKQNKN